MEEKIRQRKANIKHGVRTQKMVSFRCDLEILEALQARGLSLGKTANEALRTALKIKGERGKP